MAFFYPSQEIAFEDHPLFDGVRIAKLVGKKDNMPLGSSILRIEPGVEIPVHVHDESVDSIYCLEGKGRIFRDGQWKGLKGGDYCLVPAREQHGVRNDSGDILELFVVHCPPLF